MEILGWNEKCHSIAFQFQLFHIFIQRKKSFAHANKRSICSGVERGLRLYFISWRWLKQMQFYDFPIWRQFHCSNARKKFKQSGVGVKSIFCFNTVQLATEKGVKRGRQKTVTEEIGKYTFRLHMCNVASMHCAVEIVIMTSP